MTSRLMTTQARTRGVRAGLARRRQQRLQRLREGRERGSVSFYLVVITMGLVALAGLVIDGGYALSARGEAADSAQQAARAGANALSPAALRGPAPGGLTASPAAATAAANRVLDASGVTGTVSVAGDTVTVHVTVHRDTAILSAVGVDQISGSATATAVAVRGTTTAGGR